MFYTFYLDSARQLIETIFLKVRLETLTQMLIETA